MIADFAEDLVWDDFDVAGVASNEQVKNRLNLPTFDLFFGKVLRRAGKNRRAECGRPRQRPIEIIKIDVPTGAEQTVGQKEREGVMRPGMRPVEKHIVETGAVRCLQKLFQTPIV